MAASRSLLTLAALALSPAPALAQAVYPATEVLDAFRAACSRLDSGDAARAQVRASGWAEVADPSATPVANLIAFGREEGEKMVGAAGGKLLPMGVFERHVAGERLYIVVSGVSIGADSLIGCRLYDAAEPRRIDRAMVTGWLGREPSNAVERPEFAKYSFEPGLSPDHRDFEVYFLPEGSPLAATLKISGVGLAATKSSKPTESKEQK